MTTAPDPDRPAPGAPSGAGDGPADAPADGFGAAMAELQRIVAELESDSLDVDELAARVERAAVLVAWCRDRIDATRFAVTEVLERLEAPEPAGDTGDPGQPSGEA